MSFLKNVNIITAALFMAIGIVSGFISNMITAKMSLNPLLASFVGFAVFFILLVFMGIAKFGIGSLFLFSVIGYISSWISSFLGDMWGFSGTFWGSIMGFIVFFVILALIGPKTTGVQTAPSQTAVGQ